VDTILAVFLAAALSAGDAHQSATEPTEKCEYYVSNAAQQMLWLCEDRSEGDARQPALQQNPPTEHGSGAGSRTVPDRTPVTAAPSGQE